MPATDKFSVTKSSFQISLPGEITLLTIIACLFLTLHIAAGLILRNVLPDALATTQEAAGPSTYD
jgi:hypothetical protein